MTQSIGDTISDFTLKDHQGKAVSLTDYSGGYVLLSFHPLAWTSVCAQQMSALDNHMGTFKKLQVVPLGISVDSVPCKKAWAAELKIRELRMLSDFWPHGSVAASLGLLRGQEGFSERANLVVDGERRIIFKKVYETGQLPDIQEILNFLKTLS